MKETETTLAKTISVAGVNAAYDNACKRILSDKNILAWIMKSCLPEYKTCSVDEIAASTKRFLSRLSCYKKKYILL